jgi:nicotinate-nucleotide pyrophosphorylase (carboxylating)
MNRSEDIKMLILDSVIVALREDLGSGDITTNSIVPFRAKAAAKLTAKESGVICGLSIARLIFQSLDKNIVFSAKVKDGGFVRKGAVIATVKGSARAILTGERTALNFLQRLSGISTLTKRFVKAAGNKIKILDTRKTTPGLRVLEKYAVKMGGGHNHRIGLFDAVLVKDNHIAVAGGLKNAVREAGKCGPVEVEAENMRQVAEAIDSGVSRILLDNMSVLNVRKAVRSIKRSMKKIEIEISGGTTLSNIRAYARTGADYISVGALTHSAPALDISLKVV